MSQTELVDLEAAIKSLPGVLGCVILSSEEGHPSEIQAFTRVGADRQSISDAITEVVSNRGLGGHLRQVFVFELEAESHFGDRETLARAAELAEQEARARGPVGAVSAAPPRAVPAVEARPSLQRVVLTSSSVGSSEAEVSLRRQSDEVVGQARGEKTPYGLRVLAQATLEAAEELVGQPARFALAGASLVNTFEREAVLVVVREGGLETIGAALVRAGPISEAAVRATLDAINRRLAEG